MIDYECTALCGVAMCDLVRINAENTTARDNVSAVSHVGTCDLVRINILVLFTNA